MGRSRYKIYEEYNPYFLTCGVVDGIALFKDPDLVRYILDGLIFLQKERGVELNAYVILENHLHLIAKGENLAKHMKNFKSYSAHQIIDKLKKKKNRLCLRKLREAKRDHKTKSQFQVWDEGSHPKQLFTYEVFAQKLDYIHFNPVKRGYVDEPSHWRYSSAKDYEGQQGIIPITIFAG